MNILYVSAILPYPLHSGGQIRMYNLLKRLGRKHAITLVSFIRSDEEREFAKKLTFCRDIHLVYRGRAWQARYVLPALLGKRSFLLSTYDNIHMKQKIASLLTRRSYDLIHAEPFYVWPSIPKTQLPIVVSEHNIEYDVYSSYTEKAPWWLRSVYRRDVARMRSEEQSIWKQAHAVTAVSEKDAADITARIKKRVAVVANGVDPKQFSYRAPAKKAAPVVLFVGNFRWIPNKEAVLRLVRGIWPQLSRLFPTARLTVAGAHMDASLEHKIRQIGGAAHASVEDIVPIYMNADVLAVPLSIAGGTKYKILEAMATGLPVVSTRAGVYGLNVSSGVHYIQAQNDTDFAREIVTLLSDTKRSVTISRNARSLVERQYSWDRIASELETVWEANA